MATYNIRHSFFQSLWTLLTLSFKTRTRYAGAGNPGFPIRCNTLRKQCDTSVANGIYGYFIKLQAKKTNFLNGHSMVFPWFFWSATPWKSTNNLYFAPLAKKQIDPHTQHNILKSYLFVTAAASGGRKILLGILEPQQEATGTFPTFSLVITKYFRRQAAE